jgi:hypothetical protein
MDEELARLSIVCSEVIKDFSAATLSSFVQMLEGVPLILANSTVAFHSKLLSISSSGLFLALKQILKNPIDCQVQLRFLKFWDFLVSTSSSSESLSFLLSEQMTTTLILYPFDFQSNEVLQAYITVLKGISLHLRDIDIDQLFTDDCKDCPLYSHAVPFIVSRDSVVVSGARLLVLNCCLSKHARLHGFVCDRAVRPPFAYLMDHLGPDELEFVSDLLNVAPLELSAFVRRQLREQLMKGDLVFLATAIGFLEHSAANDILVEALSERLHAFPLERPLALGVLLYAIEHKLLLMDAAVAHGLVPAVSLPRYGGAAPAAPASRMADEITDVLRKHASVPLVALPLRILERLLREVPPVVFEVRDRLITEARAEPPNTVMEAVLAHPEPRQRCDLQFLIAAHEAGEAALPDAVRIMLQLSEVLGAIARWSDRHFLWFTPQDVAMPGTVFTVTTANQQTITLAGSNLLVGEVESLPLSRVYFGTRKERKVIIAVLMPLLQPSRRTFSGPVGKGEERRFEFLSPGLAAAFFNEVEKVQKMIVEDMLKVATEG